jgi:hypothetical protein
MPIWPRLAIGASGMGGSREVGAPIEGWKAQRGGMEWKGMGRWQGRGGGLAEVRVGWGRKMVENEEGWGWAGTDGSHGRSIVMEGIGGGGGQELSVLIPDCA